MQEVLESQLAAAGTVQRLAAEVRGEIIVPGDERYDTARGLYITGFDFRPLAIVKVADAADVARVVTFAREEGLPLAVRGGGHSLAGHSGIERGVVIDLSALNGIDIDLGGRSAWAGGGVTAGDYTRAVGKHGLATGFGDTPSVGVGGITLAGGVGFLHRRFGLTIDSLLAAEVVTANGEIITVDDDRHPELFWAIRGGGGNFGVVTRFKFRLHEVNEVLGGMLILPASPRVLHGIITEAGAAPEELSGMYNVAIAPPLPFLPPEVHGKPIVMAAIVYAGDPADGERVLAPIRALAKPLVENVKPIRYPEVYEAEGGPPPPVRIAMQPMMLDRFELSHAEAVLDALSRSTAPMRAVQFRPLGGAVARVPIDATAFPHRQRGFLSSVAAMFVNGEDRPLHDAWAAETADRLRGEDRSAYVGFLTDDDSDRIRSAYGAGIFARLREVKRRYDPENVFRRNHNVAPA